VLGVFGWGLNINQNFEIQTQTLSKLQVSSPPWI
jgi:hypothetical protein